MYIRWATRNMAIAALHTWILVFILGPYGTHSCLRSNLDNFVDSIKDIVNLTDSTAPHKPKNVLFLVSDDLRPELGSYRGAFSPSAVQPVMHTPHTDALAARSLLLQRAYVQQAICVASRTSLLTARRPDTTHVYALPNYWRDVGGNFTTLPQYFKQNGYYTADVGKIFHGGHKAGSNDPMSWSQPPFGPSGRLTKESSWRSVPATEDSRLFDELVTEKAVETLRQLAPNALNGNQPFFLAVGYYRPHLPFDCPSEFFDYYPMDNISLPDNEYAPNGMPDIAWTNYNELRSYKDIAKLGSSGEINTTLPANTTLALRRAYYACVSFVDAQVGQVLRELERLGLKDDTIVSFIGDHGFQLGEHGLWAKHTNFEVATHAPMMISIPGVTDQGVPNDELVEFVDLFPTLVEAAGLPQVPLCPHDSSSVKICREGSSMMPLLRGATGENGRWKTRVFSQYIRGLQTMGYSMRTARYRYTEWVRFTGKPTYQPRWRNPIGLELYDLLNDPQENVNIVHDRSVRRLKTELSRQLHAGWRAAAP